MHTQPQPNPETQRVNSDPRVADVSRDLSAQITEMTDMQRNLFIDTSLQNIHALSAKVASAPSDVVLAQSLAATIHALTALTGLAHSCTTNPNEEELEVSAEDTEAVNRTLVRFEDLLRAAAEVHSEGLPETTGAEEDTGYGQYL